jgi:hypothetical protein
MAKNLLVEIEAFKMLFSNLKPTNGAHPMLNKFVKMMDIIPHLDVSIATPRKKSLILHEHTLVGKFTSLWPSPKSIESWVAKQWAPKPQGQVILFSSGRGFFIFVFHSKEDQDLIFHLGPYFMGSGGLFLTRLSLDFNPKKRDHYNPCAG